MSEGVEFVERLPPLVDIHIKNELKNCVLDFVECTMEDNKGGIGGESTAEKKRNRRKPQQPRRLDNNNSRENDEKDGNEDESDEESEQEMEETNENPVNASDTTEEQQQQESKQQPPQKQIVKIPCTVCGREFASRYMTIHMRSHLSTPKRPPRRSRYGSRAKKAPKESESEEEETEEEEIDDNEEEEDGEEEEEEETVDEMTNEESGGRKPRKSKKRKLYDCYICDLSFSKREMATHLMTHAIKTTSNDGVGEEGAEKMQSDVEEGDEKDGDGKVTSKRCLKKFPCDICGKSFDRYYMLDHMRSHARRMSRALAKTRKKPERKGRKSKEAKNDDALSEEKPAIGPEVEVSTATEEPNEVLSPEFIDKVTTKTPKSRRRQREKFPCKDCGAMFNKYYMVVHMRSHTGEKPFSCLECDKQFVSSNSLNAHNQNCHSAMRGKVQCDICGRLVSSKMSLKQHLRTHSDEKPFQCHVCGKAFKQCAQLSAHVKTHSDGMPYQCEACGHRYKSVTGLIRHREYHHLGIRRKYPCDQCDKVFTRHSKLRDHLMWHKGTSPYVCKYCGKRLLSRKTLNTHLLIHEDIKPYECEVCGKAFRQNCVLKRHLTVHTGIKPFRCDQCGKQFIHRVYLVKHTCEVKEGSHTYLAL